MGEGQVEVTLIGVSDQELNTAKEAMRAKGELEFRILALRGEDDALIAAAEAGTALPDESKPFAKWTDYDPQKNSLPDGVVTREREGKHQVLVIDDELDVTAELLDYAQPMLEESGWQVAGKFNPQGAERMGKLTKRNLPRGDKMRQLGIILDGELLTAPSIQAEFSRYFQLTGNFTEDEVRLMAAVLKLGKFPAHIKPDPISEKRVAPER